ncbi:hypothetical protein [Terribacillus sp. 7520-G]|uniref:hypothetical protein n=1 Tax=Terribacillus sp. 7520-G TaxID=2025389 RepID=UPI000BA74729|nr:hypothetical protein [Terribacillus sp. 7520-G]PAD39846.1 hypothetical protein CHH53_03950 [Terribacillus sp. 7520-G]
MDDKLIEKLKHEFGIRVHSAQPIPEAFTMCLGVTEQQLKSDHGCLLALIGLSRITNEIVQTVIGRDLFTQRYWDEYGEELLKPADSILTAINYIVERYKASGYAI